MKPSEEKSPPVVTCPTCGKAHPWSRDNPFRPFCSERCKLIDLGQWAAEAYRVPDTTPLPEDTPKD